MERVIAYQLDARDRITFVSPEWLAFAGENDAPDLTVAHVVGRLVWGFVAGPTVQRMYEQLFRRVRRTRQDVMLPLRCDAPGVRRFAELTISPLADQELDIEVRLTREEPRTVMRVLEPGVRRSSRWLTICSWCKRVRVDVHRWVELDDPLVLGGLVGAGVNPHLTHGICPDCEAALQALL